MNWLQRIKSRFRSISAKRKLDQEMDEEMRSHIELRTRANIEAGMNPDEARLAASREFGWKESIKETCRDQRGVRWLENLIQDVRFGARMLQMNWGFTIVATLTLALGIGASTAIYSVVNGVLLNPVPGPHPERTVQIAEQIYTRNMFKEQDNKPFFVGVSPPELDALLAEQNFFSRVTWYNAVDFEHKTPDFAERTPGVMVSSNFFELWNVRPLLGRTFALDEAVPFDDIGGKPLRDTVVVLSYTGWQKLYGGDQSVIGKTLELSGCHFTVIGVMPKWFQPESAYEMFWLPAEPVPTRPDGNSSPNIRFVARLRPETTQVEAQAMLDVLAARLMKDYPGNVKFGYGRDWRERPNGLGFWIRPLRAGIQDSDWNNTGDFQRTLVGLLGAMFFVLMIVCANIANLTLARTERRQHELAIRASIGAGRGRLMRQLLTECLLLSGVGGLGGLVVSVWGIKLLLSLVPASMSRLQPVAIDGHVLACTLVISIGTGLLFGLVPAWRAGQIHLNDALKQAGTGATIGLRRSRYRSALVVAEVALAVVLLAGAGLMVKSVIRMLHVDPGFDPENLVRVNLQLPWNKYNDQRHPEDAALLRKVLYGQLQELLAALPGVRAVGVGKHGSWPIRLKPEGRSESVETVLDGCGVGASDLFQAMHIPLLAGRWFDKEDLGEAAGTAIINETMARTVWPGEQAVGKKFGGATPYGDQTFQVVGVVGDIRDYSYKAQLRSIFYRPCDELYLEGSAPFLFVRTQADPGTLIPAIRRELKEAEPDMRTPGFTVETQTLYDSTQAQRIYMVYLVVFAGVGVLLCAIGVYGVLAYSVVLRVREIGIRIAVGAQRGDVLWMVIVEGMRLVFVGAGVGLLAAFLLTRLLQSQLFEVSPNDPTVMSAVVLLLVAVALLACYFPARRAAGINPMTALRHE